MLQCGFAHVKGVAISLDLVLSRARNMGKSAAVDVNATEVLSAVASSLKSHAPAPFQRPIRKRMQFMPR